LLVLREGSIVLITKRETHDANMKAVMVRNLSIRTIIINLSEKSRMLQSKSKPLKDWI